MGRELYCTVIILKRQIYPHNTKGLHSFLTLLELIST